MWSKIKAEFVFWCRIIENKINFNQKGGEEGTVSSCILMLSYFLEEDLDFNSMFNQVSLLGKKIAHVVKMPIQGYGGVY